MRSICRICGASIKFAFSTKDYNRRCSSEVFDYSQCSMCRTYALSNVPENLANYYPDDYYSLPRNLAEADQSISGEEYKLALVRRYASAGRLLEIGPGAGMFAHLAAKHGFQVEAIEMSAQSASFIQGVLGIPVHHTEDEVAALGRCEPYDVIVMWHVIEHLVDPASLVKAVAAKLVKGGVLVIATPNPSALQFKILRGHWAHIDAPRHVFLIPPTALCAEAARNGLATRFLTSSDEGTLYWNRFGWEVSLRNMFEGRTSQRFAAACGRAISKLVTGVERIEGQGSAYTVVFMKE